MGLKSFLRQLYEYLYEIGLKRLKAVYNNRYLFFLFIKNSKLHIIITSNVIAIS